MSSKASFTKKKVKGRKFLSDGNIDEMLQMHTIQQIKMDRIPAEHLHE